jgi:hypothetical protein
MIKRRFARTNKRNFTAQLATAELRIRFMRHVRTRLEARSRLPGTSRQRMRRRKRAQAESNDSEVLDTVNSTRRYDIADTTRESENILEWVHTNRHDVATKVWHSK